MEVNSFKCDVCGTMKTENNHWQRLVQSEDGLVLRPWRLEPLPNEQHLDSDACVLKVVQAWLSSQKERSDADRRDAEGVTSVGSEVERDASVPEV